MLLLGGNIEEVEQDWRENLALAFVDLNGTESSVDPPREQARLDAASGHTSRATTGLERPFHNDQHYHRDDKQRQDWPVSRNCTLQINIITNFCLWIVAK